MNGYTEPADCTGLSGGYDRWRDKSLAKSCTWTKHDAAAAGKALDAAGYRKGKDGKRTLKNGKPFAFDVSVGSASPTGSPSPTSSSRTSRRSVSSPP